MSPLHKMDISLVEDNEDLSFLIEKAIDQIDKGFSLKIIDNGLTAHEVLQQYNYENTRPRIILLN